MRPITLLLVLSAMLAAAACGGEAEDTSSPGGQSGSSGTGGTAGTAGTGGSGGTAGSGGIAGSAGAAGSGGSTGSACPPDVPDDQSACTEEGRVCSYGSDPRLSCRTKANCESGTWTVVVTPPCTAPSSPDCPLDPSQTSTDFCDTYLSIFCTYDAGKLCGCVWSGGVPVDGGMEEIWACSDPVETGCPDTAPNLGTPCTLSEQTLCAYGIYCDKYSLQCTDGFWVDGPKFGCAG
jgi:hypothetical protein